MANRKRKIKAKARAKVKPRRKIQNTGLNKVITATAKVKHQ